MKFKILLIITIGIMLYACSGNGSPVRDYKFNAQDINQVKNAANQGDAGAMYELGMAYLGTTGMVDEDYKQGLSWLTKSAEKGDSLAQSTLGGFYLSEKMPVKGGKNHVQDFSKARYWYEKGAAQNAGVSQLGLATIYSEGLGVTKDDKIASEWLRKAKANRDNITIPPDLMYLLK